MVELTGIPSQNNENVMDDVAHLVELANISNYHPSQVYIVMAGKIRFSAALKSILLKASSGEHCVSRNFVHLVTLQGTGVRLIVYLVLHQIKYVTER